MKNGDNFGIVVTRELEVMLPAGRSNNFTPGFEVVVVVVVEVVVVVVVVVGRFEAVMLTLYP